MYRAFMTCYKEGAKDSRGRGFEEIMTEKIIRIYFLNSILFINASFQSYFHLNPRILGPLNPFLNKSRK
jgi:hypothetical protein